jgi:cell division protein ZapA (FtsZ GTPase activity inhibitor)
MGRELQVKTAAPPEAVQAIEAFVNEKLAEVSGALASADSHQVTILALLNIAESYLALQQESSAYRRNAEETATRLLQRIDQIHTQGYTVS